MKLIFARAALLAAAMALVSAPLLAAEGNLAGVVRDESGNPVAGAKVVITSSNSKDLNVPLTTDDAGAFSTTIPNTRWAYVIRVEHEGFSASQLEILKVPATPVSVTLRAPFGVPVPPPPPKVDPAIAAYNDGVELIQKGDRAGAEKKFDEAVAGKPDLAAAWKVISQLAYERKDYAKALSAGRKLLELDPKDKDLYGILMDSAQKSGDTAAAADFKKKFVEANLDNPEVNFNAGAESYTAGDYAAAAASFSKAVELKPDMANAYFWLGMANYNLKKFNAARGNYQKYLELAPQGDQVDNAKKMLEALPAK